MACLLSFLTRPRLVGKPMLASFLDKDSEYFSRQWLSSHHQSSGQTREMNPTATLGDLYILTDWTLPERQLCLCTR